MGSNKMIPIPILIGSLNYVEWHCAFVRAAKAQDVWNLHNGEFERSATAPQPDHRPYQLRTRSGQFRARGGEDVVSDRSVSDTIVLTRTIAAVACFEYDRKLHENSQRKIKKALTLISDSISPLAARTIRNIDCPFEAYKLLKKSYGVPANVAAESLSDRLRSISLDHYENDVETYLAEIFNTCSDMTDYGHKPNDGVIAKHILAGLPDSYQSFKGGWSHLSEQAVSASDLEKLYADLLAEAARQEYENRSLMD